MTRHNRFHIFLFCLLALALLMCAGWFARGQEKKPKAEISSIAGMEISLSDDGIAEIRKRLEKCKAPKCSSVEVQISYNAESKEMTYQEFLDRTLNNRPCSHAKLLDALVLADRLFVNLPITAKGDTDGSKDAYLSFPLSIASSVTTGPRKSDELRAIAERLKRDAAENERAAKVMEKVERQQAAEQHEKDEAATKIREILRACR